jgi:hypothetical protein
MTGTLRRGFAERPGATTPSADAWVRSEPAAAEPRRADVYAARLTIDVTKALRGRIKMAAFAQGLTVADMLRDLLDRHFPDHSEPSDTDAATARSSDAEDGLSRGGAGRAGDD